MPRPSNTHLFVLGAPWLLPSSKHCLPVPSLTPFSCSFPSPPQWYQTNGHQWLCIEKITRKKWRISFSFTASWGSAGTSSNPGHCIDPTERFLYKVSDNRVFETTQPPGSIQLVCRLHSRLCPPRCAALIFFMGSDVNTHTWGSAKQLTVFIFTVCVHRVKGGWRTAALGPVQTPGHSRISIGPVEPTAVGGAVVARYCVLLTHLLNFRPFDKVLKWQLRVCDIRTWGDYLSSVQVMSRWKHPVWCSSPANQWVWLAQHPQISCNLPSLTLQPPEPNGKYKKKSSS